MKIAVCIDERGGMLFGGKRQSRDRELIDDLMRTAGDGALYISPFSAPLFEGRTVRVAENPLSVAEDADFVFVENIDIAPHLDKIDEIVVYKWNRRYPRDVLLGFEPSKCGFSLCESVDFVGSSHEKITKEIYKR